MGNGKKTYESMIEENIRQYRLDDLLDKEKVEISFLQPAQAFGIEILITCRHGEEFLATPQFQGQMPDVVNQPGDKLRVGNRTVGHVYADFSGAQETESKILKNWYQGMLILLSELLRETYLRTEAENYISEAGSRYAADGQQEADTQQAADRQKKDSLTGVYNKSYFQSRMKVIERSEVVPVAFVLVNVNDTKFFFDTYGESEGNRLLCIVADALKQCAGQEYIIGRCGVDVFHVMIPLPEEGEVKTYCRQVKEILEAYEDDVLAPSAAMGIVYKSNVEEGFEDILSDAEFEMLSDKMQIKQQPEYEQKKCKGLQK